MAEMKPGRRYQIKTDGSINGGREHEFQILDTFAPEWASVIVRTQTDLQLAIQIAEALNEGVLRQWGK